MRYVLAFGYNYKKYQKEANIKISSAGIMIDDLCVDEYTPVHTSKPFSKKFLFYELDEKAIGDSITFKVEVHDNNYTNGFMSKTSLFRFVGFGLFPLAYIRNIDTKRTDKYKWNCHQYFPRQDQLDPNKRLFSIPEWPSNHENFIWRDTSGPNNVNDKDGVWQRQIEVWRGRDFEVSIPVITKFKQKMFDPYDDKKYGMMYYDQLYWEPILKQYRSQVINTSK